MKLCVDWEAVHQDWLASGLSKNRYFLSGRIEKCICEGVAPCYSMFLRRQISNNPVTEQRTCAFSCRYMKRPKQTTSAIFLRGCWRAVGPTICTAPTER